MHTISAGFVGGILGWVVMIFIYSLFLPNNTDPANIRNLWKYILGFGILGSIFSLVVAGIKYAF